jgi:uncharacterized NAD(P)/FAD-binding protein YdhS
MRVTIVGAGFAGTALARELVSRHARDLDVHLVGDAATFGRGVAYGHARPEHYLNVRADELGVDPTRPREFADWLDLGEANGRAFLPRQVYGEYLSRQLSQTINTAQVPLQLHAESVIAVERRTPGFRVFLADGSDYFSDQVVLAVGALPPQPLAALEGGLLASPAYVGWPWADGALDAIDSDARVLIVGTGLTMVDVVVSLRQRGHVGPIEAISRHGLTPHVHGPVRQAAAVPAALTRAIERGDLRGLLRTVRGLVRVVDDWRSLIDAIRPQAQSLWQRLPSASRASFMRHLRSYWEMHRHRIAPEVAREIEAMRHSGQLQLGAARLLHARAAADEIEAFVRYRGDAHARVDRYDTLIRATGLDTDIANTHHALIAHLRESNLLQADPLGLGVVSRPDGQVLDRDGRAVEGLFCLGALQRGALWESIAIPELRAAARALAQHLRAAVPRRSEAAARDTAHRVEARAG